MEPVDEPSRARAPRRPFPAPSVGHSPGKVRGRVPGVRVARARAGMTRDDATRCDAPGDGLEERMVARCGSTN